MTRPPPKFKKGLAGVDAAYFWRRVEKVAPNGCWLWKGTVSSEGYGVVHWPVEGRVSPFWSSHALAFWLTDEKVTAGPPRLRACPTNRLCCNPAHLSIDDRLATDDPARFWCRVDKTAGPDSCWPWAGGGGNGNHVMTQWLLDGSRVSIHVHRLAYWLTHGVIFRKDQGILLRHTCDFGRCCNPRHLIPGSPRENMNDKVVRGRQPRGEESKCARLTAGAVIAIRARCAAGDDQRKIAKDYGVSQPTVSAINVRRIWAHID